MLIGRPQLLNARPVESASDAVALSQRLLAEARTLTHSGECTRLDAIAGQLHGIEPAAIEGDAARLAFWVNLYNGLLLHCLCRRPVRGSLLWHLRLFDRVGYEVGGSPYSLNLIEHGMLRRNRRPPYHLRRPLRPVDPRLRAAVGALDPRVHFALNCGARSCPPIRVYEPDRIESQLEDATRSYLAAEMSLDGDTGRVTLPRLMRLYRAEFGSAAEQLAFSARYLPELRAWLADGRGDVRIRYGPFDWTVAPAGPPL
jgi:hypothetical protein